MIRAERLPGDHPDALALTEAMVGEIVAAYGPAAPGATPTATPEELSPPDGIFVVLYEDDRAVAGGGVKQLSEDVGEIKRMYVVPGARSRGLARRLLAELEQAARDLGYPRVRLDTGVKQRHAQQLYRSTGYTEIDDYNGNTYASYWAEKSL